jgi:phage terminase large subunit
LNIDLLYYQHEFLTSKSKSALLLGGVGSGKSAAGAFFIINLIAAYPKIKILVVANTFSQLMNATVSTLINFLELCNISYNVVWSGARKRIEIGTGVVFLYSLERYDVIRGIEVGAIWGDEIAFAKKESLPVIKGRLRQKGMPLIERYTSSPNGFNFIYDIYENKDGENKTDKTHLIRAKTKDNIFLPEDFYGSLLEDYGGIDNPLAQQELMGQFVNLQSGAIYWGFDRRINVQPVKLNKDFPVYVGQDFNIDQMANCYVQFIEGKFHVAQENILKYHGANTDNAASKIVKDLSQYNSIVIPDSTGKARKTSSHGRTDIDILKSYGLEVMNTRNPFIRDRQNTLNIHFKKNDVIIDPSCKTLIKEIEILASRDKEGDNAHVSVGLGYVTNALKPLKVKKKSTFS